MHCKPFSYWPSLILILLILDSFSANLPSSASALLNSTWVEGRRGLSSGIVPQPRNSSGCRDCCCLELLCFFCVSFPTRYLFHMMPPYRCGLPAWQEVILFPCLHFWRRVNRWQLLLRLCWCLVVAPYHRVPDLINTRLQGAEPRKFGSIF